MRPYNLFRRKGAVDLFCAVPQDMPVPNFVIAGEWDRPSARCRDPVGV